MRKIYLLFLTLILNIVYVSAANCGGNVTCHCGDTLTSSYNMTEDILNCNSNALRFGASNLVLDCQGHIIDGTDNPNYRGVWVNYNNSEIKNCVMQEFNQGVYISSQSQGSNVHNNIFTNNTQGPYTDTPTPADVYIASSYNNTIRDNTIIGTIPYPNNVGIGLANIANDNLIKNNFISKKNGGIGVDWTSRNNVIDGNFIYNSWTCISSNGDFGVIKNNAVSNCGKGVYFSQQAEFNNITNNTIFNNQYGLHMGWASYNNTIWSNNFTNNLINAEEFSGTGIPPRENKYNLSNVGNYWDDYEDNIGYPNIYIINNRSYGGKDYHPIWDYSANRPIIYVHGYCSEPGENSEMINSLRAQGYNVTELDYAPGSCHWPYTSPGCANRDIKAYSAELKKKIDEIKVNTGAKKVNLVTHSMGGLVARWYVENPSIYGNDVDQLIEIGTPNHGAETQAKWQYFLIPNFIAEIRACGNKGTSVDEMKYNSHFLSKLNYNENKFNWDKWQTEPETINNNVDYKIIAGNYPLFTTPMVKKVPVSSSYPAGLRRVDSIYGDLIVSVYNSRLRNSNVGCDDFPEVHWKIAQDNEVIDTVKYFLRDKPTQNDNCNYEDKNLALRTEEELLKYGFSPINSDSITLGESKTYEIDVDSSIQNITFSLFWERDTESLSLNLIDPNEVEYNENSSDFYETDVSNQYYFDDPVDGTWILNITGINVDQSENYEVGSGFLTSYLMGLDSYDYNYTVKPGETFKFIGYIVYNESIYQDIDNFAARIITPSGNNIELEMYDDGDHNDYESNDGIYGNSYVLNELGSYKSSIVAIGNLGNEKIIREADLTFWGEAYPELSLNSSDLTFNSNDIYIGQKITISAVIHNTGDVDAIDIPVMFYENNSSGELIGSSVIDVNMGGTNTASVEWVPLNVGSNKIYVVVTPFGNFYENNYENNYASKIVNVKTRVGSSPLILKNTPAKTQELR